MPSNTKKIPLFGYKCEMLKCRICLYIHPQIYNYTCTHPDTDACSHIISLSLSHTHTSSSSHRHIHIHTTHLYTYVNT